MVLKRIFGILASLPLTLAGIDAIAQDEIVDPAPPEPDATAVPVSDQDLEAELEAGAPVVDEEQQLLTEFMRFKQLMNEGAIDEADSVAKRVIELAIRTKGAQSPEMASALTNLAIVQHKSRQFDAAQQNYQSAIEIIEEVEDRLHAHLVNPLKGLAAAQLESGRPDLATTTYRRAVHVTHVNEGPHNLDQISLLEDLSEVQLRMGDLDTAKDIQDTIYALNVRAHNSDGVALIPALMRRAEWQQRAGFIYDQRTTYRRVIRITEQRFGKDNIALVEPLVKLGRSFFYVDTSGQESFHQSSLSTGEIYFKRAVRIAAESPESNWTIVADSTLALADYYMWRGNSQRARQVYRNVWDLLSESEDDADKLAKRRAELQSTVVLKERPLPNYVGESNPALGSTPEDPILQGTVTVTYSISPRGRPVNLKLVEAEPAEFADMRGTVQREVRRRIYRPHFADAEPVATEGHVLVHTFYYKKSDLDGDDEDT